MSADAEQMGRIPEKVMHAETAQDVFDGVFYLATNDDVREAGIDPWQHYVSYGGAEGRDPAPWFSDIWYRAHVLQPFGLLDVPNPLDHWLGEGRGAGFAPSTEAEMEIRAQALPEFDAEYYLAANPDVAAHGADPWQHFLDFGWREDRAPSEAFDIRFYREQQKAEGRLVAGRNPLLHWVAVGRAGGWPISAAKVEKTGGATQSLDALVEMLEAARPDLPEADADLLAGSALFDPAHLAAQDTAYEGLSRAEAAARYAQGAPDGGTLDPSPLFAARFYRHHYGDLMAPGQTALAHYLRQGRDLGLPPSPEAAWRDVLRLRLHAGGTDGAAGLRANYISLMRHAPRRGDIIEDYVLHGVAAGSPLSADVNEGFVRTLYSQLVPGGIGSPAGFVARGVRNCWIYGTPESLRHDADILRSCGVFDDRIYAQTAQLSDGRIDPAEHYVTAGVATGLPAGPEFDTVRYMVRNPDLANAPIVPAVHFDKYGRAEGRVAHSTWYDHPDAAKATHNPDLPTVVILTHEASRTGAPIVALNIARTLAETHNVISWVDDDGPLTADFGAVSTRVLIDYGNPRDMEAALRQIIADTGIKVAIVSSVVSSLAMPALRMAGVPVISLIHEFADYVAPLGKTSRMALYSDAAVFPADLVRSACAREIDALGLGPAPDMLKIRPQGYNVAGGGEAELTASDLMDLIDAPKDRSRCRIMFGAGWVQPRKGVDLFLQVATALKDDPDYDWRFIWVGGNYHPDTDMVVSIYLAHQMREAGLTSQMTFLPEQKSLEPFWEISDIFLMSSRLDPYPNVALEALYRSVPVVCFQGATGIADLSVDYPFAVRAAPFADIEASARDVRTLLAPDMRAALEGAAGDRMRDQLSFDAYVADLVAMMEPALEGATLAAVETEALEAVRPDDLALAARHLPPRLCLSTIPYTDILRRSLGEQANRLGLKVDSETGALIGAAGDMPARTEAGLRPWTPAGGQGGDVGPSNLSELVIHVPDRDGFEVLKALLTMLPRTALPVRLVAGLPWLVKPLQELLEDQPRPGVQVEPRAAQRAAEAAARIADTPGPDYIAVLSTACEPDASAAAQAIPAAPEGGVLAAVLSGAAEAYLTANASCPAVLGAMSIGHRSGSAEARVAETSRTYAPRFCGIYRRTALRSFASAALPALQEDGAGLAPADWDALAALHFLRRYSEDGTLTMLPVLPLL